MIIELLGLPGSGKSTIARSLESSGKAERICIMSRTELVWRSLFYVLRHPLSSLAQLYYLVRYAGSARLFYTKFMNLFLQHAAKYQKARGRLGTVVIDQGHLQNLLSLFERPMPEATLARCARFLSRPDELWICTTGEEERHRRLASRGYGGGNELRASGAVEENFRTAERVIRSFPDLSVRVIES